MNNRHSGMAIKAFCQQQGVAQASFYAWRRSIQERDLKLCQDQTEHDRLIPVSIVAAIDDATQGEPIAAKPIEIVTPSGFTLRVDQAVLPQRLAVLLDVIARCQQAGAGSC